MSRYFLHIAFYVTAQFSQEYNRCSETLNTSFSQLYILHFTRKSNGIFSLIFLFDTLFLSRCFFLPIRWKEHESQRFLTTFTWTCWIAWQSSEAFQIMTMFDLTWCDRFFSSSSLFVESSMIEFRWKHKHSSWRCVCIEESKLVNFSCRLEVSIKWHRKMAE